MPNPISGSNFIAGELSATGTQQISATDPTTDQAISPGFFVATEAEIEAACLKAKTAFDELQSVSPAQRADFLDRIADNLSEIAEAAIERAMQETALTKPRLTGEVGRTQGQLRMFATLIREGSWVDAHIDHGNPDRTPAPKPDLRRMLVPLGPIAVFGASNFPFAFSVAGGDTASALAAGCSVVVKAHPAHPGTSELVAAAITSAAQATGMPAGIFSMIHGGAEVGEHLVKNDHLEAVAFTGSLAGGTAIMRTVAARPRPIPVYAEMGSINPIVVLPSALEAEDNGIAKGYVASLTLGVGQFCTNPGLLVGVGEPFDHLCTQIKAVMGEQAPGTMLTSGIRNRYVSMTRDLHQKVGDQTGEASSETTVKPNFFRVTAAQFKADSSFAEEVFGPSAVAVRCDSVEELLQLIQHLPGQLTAGVQAGPSDPTLTHKVLNVLARIAGRVIYNSYPTGVEVAPAMQHGGPFPATSDSRTTSVGTAAIFRFARPVAYQGIPDEMLPTELQEANPAGIARTVDGVLVS